MHELCLVMQPYNALYNLMNNWPQLIHYQFIVTLCILISVIIIYDDIMCYNAHYE